MSVKFAGKKEKIPDIPTSKNPSLIAADFMITAAYIHLTAL